MSMRFNLFQLIKFCCTWTVPAAETKSIGLPSNALVPCFLLATKTISSWQETSLPSTGTWYHLDNFIMTRHISSIYRDWQKTRHRDADANSLNRRAVMVHSIGVLKSLIKTTSSWNLNSVHLSGLISHQNFRDWPQIGSVLRIFFDKFDLQYRPDVIKSYIVHWHIVWYIVS